MSTSTSLGSALTAGLLVLGGCQSSPPRAVEPTPLDAPAHAAANVDRLAAYMTGVFSSAEQAKADPENYRPIVLHTARIWRDRTDGVWLYVEQAVETAQARPYRQRIYHLTSDATTVRSDVYTLPGNPLDFAGAWRESNKLAGVTPESLTLRDGCSILLTVLPDGTFQGGTSGQGCASELAGASYATSEAHIFPDRMVTWDRGFSRAGQQVWGAEKGGYVFLKARPAAW